MRKCLLLLGATVGLLVGFTLARTVRYGSIRPVAVEAAPFIAIPNGAAERLAGSLRMPTISHEDPAAFAADAFRALHAYLQTAFPQVHSQIERETVSTHSLLYTWRGSDPSLKPILLAGHLDVVPVEPGTEAKWQEEPFGGRITDGFIWGRGAIDNKSAIVGTLEAVEMLLGGGFRPVRTVYLAYGHDEEVGGMGGAREIAALLKTRGVGLEMVLDEGGSLVMRHLERSLATNAMVRTTTAATVFQAGTKDNVLPSYARAVINSRIVPGDSVARVVEHVRRVIDDDRVEVRIVGAFSAEPSKVSSSESENFRTLERTIRSITPDVIVAPYLVVVVTDARYYVGLSRDVLRFLPLRLTARDLERIHGTDERIAVPHYEDAIRTYRQLILNAAGN